MIAAALGALMGSSTTEHDARARATADRHWLETRSNSPFDPIRRSLPQGHWLDPNDIVHGRDNVERVAEALESIARSLDKLANPAGSGYQGPVSRETGGKD